MNILERFIKYVKIDTRSNPESESTPSTEKQLNLATLLKEELIALGLENVTLDDNGYVYGKLPANTDKNIPAIGFISHMDTSPDMSGTNVNPIIRENYNGEDIILNKEKNIILSPDDFPELKNYRGQTLVTTDGTTLLGADDKAGIAEIITAVEVLVQDKTIKHGDIFIGFTPDEEIGRGADKFDLEQFNARYAYTVDGGEIGGLEYESFNAAMATIKINGRNVHPGDAKDKMVNSMELAMKLHSMLPENQKPEYTEGYEGFFHLISLNGTVEESEMKYIIRDHDREKFEIKKNKINNIVDFLNNSHDTTIININIKDQYYNMGEKIKPVMEIIDIAREAMKEAQVEPIITPIRGGTDGSRLSYMGLPTPNIFTGGHNYHGKYEYIPLESMKKSVEVIVNIIKLTASK